MDLFHSALEYIDPEISVEWLVFTNEVDKSLIENLDPRFFVKVVFQESLTWPLPTLLRYELISQNAQEIQGDIVMHLDADMLFVSTLKLSDLNSGRNEKFIKLIPHPGYFRPKGRRMIGLYLQHPRVLARDFKLFIEQGARGSWEKRKSSLAYVPRKKKRVYFCGGTWLGTRGEILGMAMMLANRVREDLKNNMIARYHDESHLNWYASEFEIESGSVSMCHEPTYPQLNGIKPIIEAVNKNQIVEWKRL